LKNKNANMNKTLMAFVLLASAFLFGCVTAPHIGTADIYKPRIPKSSKIIVTLGSIENAPFDFSSKVESILLNMGYRVVDRSCIDKIIKEQKLSVSGAVNREQQIEIGKLSGADYMLLGAVSTEYGIFLAPNKTKIQFRIINLKTAEVAAAGAMSTFWV